MKLIAGIALGAVAVSASHPIQNVIDQMVKLRIQAKEEGEAETLTYNKFSHWCGKEQESLTGKIGKNNEKISGFESAIAGHKASIASLEDEIAKLKSEIEKRNGDQAKADELRTKEMDIFMKKKADLEATVQAIRDAVKALKGSKSVLQVRAIVKKAAVVASSKMDSEARHAVHAFLQETEDGPAGTPEDGETVGDAKRERARKYDFKSGNVIELLVKLGDDFASELKDTLKAETNAVNGHEMITQAQTAAVDAATKAQNQKEKILGDTESELTDAQADLGDERRDLALNQKTLKETVTDCTSRAGEFSERSAAREGEQAALSEAVKILAKVTGLRPSDYTVARKGPGGPPGVFMQLASRDSPKQQDAKAKAVALIAAAAAKSKDAMVQRLAQQIKMAKGPFKQIKNMIQKMVFRLNKEQQDEDAHKNWCDAELETTEQQKGDKQDQVDEMQAKVESLTAKIEELREALQDAEKAIADTQQYMKDETDMRGENKAENKQTIVDAKDAQAALAQAIGVLTQYYKESGAIAKKEWEAMIQTGSAQAPALDYEGTFGNTDGSSAVMSLLETTLGDYSKMEAEAVAAEESESENFDQDMSENKIALAELRNEVKVKTARKTTLEEDKSSTASLLKKGEKQLEALSQYLKDLDQPCVSGSSDYETRKGARASEVTALKEALDVLAEAFKPKSFLAVH